MGVATPRLLHEELAFFNMTQSNCIGFAGLCPSPLRWSPSDAPRCMQIASVFAASGNEARGSHPQHYSVLSSTANHTQPLH